VPFALRAKLTWLVIARYRSSQDENGGLASNTTVLPMFLERETRPVCRLGSAAMLGKGTRLATRPTIWWSATVITTVSGVNDEQT